jgi:hypothetical protein
VRLLTSFPSPHTRTCMSPTSTSSGALSHDTKEKQKNEAPREGIVGSSWDDGRKGQGVCHVLVDERFVRSVSRPPLPELSHQSLRQRP